MRKFTNKHGASEAIAFLTWMLVVIVTWIGLSIDTELSKLNKNVQDLNINITTSTQHK